MTLCEFLAKVGLTYIGFYLLSNAVSLGGKIFLDQRLVGSIIVLSKDFISNKHGRKIKRRKKKIEATILSYDDKSGVFSMRCNASGKILNKINLNEENFRIKKMTTESKNFTTFLFRFDLISFLVIFGSGMAYV